MKLGRLFARAPGKHRVGVPRALAGADLSLIQIHEDFLALHNGGTRALTNVRIDPTRSSITIKNRVDRPFDLPPGGSWTFLVESLQSGAGATCQITVTWDGRSKAVCVPLRPPGRSPNAPR